MANTITATNSVFMLSIPGLFPVPFQLQGFAADDAFTTESVEAAQMLMGVDGQASAGYVPVLTPQSIMLMADSASGFYFDQWMAAQKAIQELMPALGSITLPSLSQQYTMQFGILTGYVAVPDVKKVLSARTFKITWGRVDSAPYL